MASRLPGLIGERPGPTRDAGATVARLHRLTRSFGTRHVLDGLELHIASGEFVAMVGRSGSGKSTVLRVLGGIDRDAEGDVDVDGEVAVAFQDARLAPWKRVLANVTLGLRAADANDVARRALGEVGLGEHLDAWPSTLSGGEAQRVSLARALVREPSLLLLDEPFGSLDALTRIAMHDLVLRLWTNHRPAVLLVTHDVDEALALADRVLVLSGGRIAFQASISSARPREREAAELVDLRTRLLHELDITPKGQTL
jgi:sulfonate transport system ATP-binding protein